jgi:hypothetical protein
LHALRSLTKRTETAANVEAALERVTEASNSAVLAAESITDVVVTGGTYGHDGSTAYVVIGVLMEASGRGIGGALLDHLDAQAPPDWTVADWLRDPRTHPPTRVREPALGLSADRPRDQRARPESVGDEVQKILPETGSVF